MTLPTSTDQQPDSHHLSWMSDEQYVTHQRRVDEEISKRFYDHGLVPPGVTPMPSAVARLEPPFSHRARGNAGKRPAPARQARGLPHPGQHGLCASGRCHTQPISVTC